MNKKMHGGWLAAFPALMAFGCGGGGTGDPTPGSFVQEYGPVTVRSTTASAPPAVWANGQATYASFYGAVITDVRVRFPAPSGGGVNDGQSNTLLAYTRNGQTRIQDLGTGTWWPLSPDPPFFNVPSWPSISGLGTRVATSEWDPVSNMTQIFMTNIDGTGRRRMTASTTNHALQPAFSMDGTRIYYVSLDSSNALRRILSLPVAGGAATALTTPVAAVRRPCVSPDGKLIAYTVESGNFVSVRTMKTDGSSNTLLTTIEGDVAMDLSWIGPSSSNLLCLISGAGGTMLYRISLTGPQVTAVTGTVQWSYATGSPLSDAFVYGSQEPGNTGLFQRSITDGTSNTVQAAEGLSSPSWGPYIQSRVCVGAGGAVGTNSNGVIVSFTDGSVRSVVSTVAANPASVQVAPVPEGQGGATSTYRIQADQIQNLAYVNHLYGPMSTVVTQGTPASYCTGALVTMSNSTGKVAFVTTYVGTTPHLSKEGAAGSVITGNIVGVFGADGKNIAPNGASEVRLNTKTGTVLSVR